MPSPMDLRVSPRATPAYCPTLLGFHPLTSHGPRHGGQGQQVVLEEPRHGGAGLCGVGSPGEPPALLLHMDPPAREHRLTKLQRCLKERLLSNKFYITIWSTWLRIMFLAHIFDCYT